MKGVDVVRGIDKTKEGIDPIFEHLLDFSNPRLEASIDPILGAQIRLPGEVAKIVFFTKQPRLNFIQRQILRSRPKAAAVIDKSGGYITDLLNGKADWKELKALPFSRVGASSEGTRGLRVISSRFPGKILCLTGIGVVKGRNIGKFEQRSGDPEFVIEPPQDRIKLSEKMQMGTMHVDAEGHMWSAENHSPFGSYAPGDAANKAEQTQKYGPEFGVELVAWGRYTSSGNEWLAYTIPDDSFSPLEAIVADIRVPTESVGKVFGPVVESLFTSIRSLHDKRLMHSQVHPGNWFVGFQNGAPVARIADWSTVRNVDALESREIFEGDSSVSRLAEWEGEYQDLTPSEKALAVDLSVALRGAVTLINSPQLSGLLGTLGIGRFDSAEKELSIDATDFWFTSQMLAYEMHILTRAATAYLGITDDDNKMKLLSHFFGKLEEFSDIRAEKSGFKERGLRNQVGEQYVEHAVLSGITDLITYTAKRMVTDQFAEFKKGHNSGT